MSWIGLEPIETIALGCGTSEFEKRPYVRLPAVSFVTTVRQVLLADGRTQASSVMPVVKSSEPESATVTRSSVPSNVSAPPDLPEAVQVAPEMLPELPLPEW